MTTHKLGSRRRKRTLALGGVAAVAAAAGLGLAVATTGFTDTASPGRSIAPSRSIDETRAGDGATSRPRDMKGYDGGPEGTPGVSGYGRRSCADPAGGRPSPEDC